MLGLIFIVVAGILYGLFSWVTFNDEIRDSRYFLIYGLAYAILANLSWIILVKNLSNPKHIVYYSLVWDVLMALVGLAIPIIFFGMRFSSISIIGITLIIAGTLVIKLGETS